MKKEHLISVRELRGVYEALTKGEKPEHKNYYTGHTEGMRTGIKHVLDNAAKLDDKSLDALLEIEILETLVKDFCEITNPFNRDGAIQWQVLCGRAKNVLEQLKSNDQD